MTEFLRIQLRRELEEVGASLNDATLFITSPTEDFRTMLEIEKLATFRLLVSKLHQISIALDKLADDRGC